MKTKSQPGIYGILHIITQSIYIGSATRSIADRFTQHKSLLRRNKHKNQHLQHAWTMHGENAFDFVVIENYTPEMCLLREQYWFDAFKEHYTMYNIGDTITFPNHAIEATIKDWLLIDPNGNELHIRNLRAFCIANALDTSAIRKVALGIVRSYKGYTSPAFVAPPSRNKQVKIICEVCKRSFKVKHSHVDRRRFCSIACRNLFDTKYGHFATNNPKSKR